jgi:hypothetical protein
MSVIGDLQPALNGSAPCAALRQVQTQIDNLQQAWHEAALAPHPAHLARGLQGMVDYWTYMGLYREGERALGEALTRVQTFLDDDVDAAADLHPLLVRLLIEHSSMLFGLGTMSKRSRMRGRRRTWRSASDRLRAARQRNSVLVRRFGGKVASTRLASSLNWRWK